MNNKFKAIIAIIILVGMTFAFNYKEEKPNVNDRKTEINNFVKANPIGPDGTNPMLMQANDVYCYTLHGMNMGKGTYSDSTLVFNATTKALVKAPPLNSLINSMVIVDPVTVGMSKAQLNTKYPNVPIGCRVLAGNILLGGAIYTKYSENGTNDVWLTSSATPTL